MTGTIEQIVLGRYFRGLAESEAMRAIVEAGLKPAGIRLEGSRIFYSIPGKLEEIELCKCRSEYEAATVARELQEKTQLHEALTTLTGELAGLLRAYSAAVYYFASNEKPKDIGEQQQLNAVADRLELTCEYGNDLFDEIVLPFLHQGRFAVSNMALNREKTRTVRMIQAAEDLLEQLNLSVATGQEFDEGVVEAAAALKESMELPNYNEGDEDDER